MLNIDGLERSHVSGVARILQMCMHILFFVCNGGVGGRREGGRNPPHPTPHKEKKAREVYALRFVCTS